MSQPNDPVYPPQYIVPSPADPVSAYPASVQPASARPASAPAAAAASTPPGYAYAAYPPLAPPPQPPRRRPVGLIIGLAAVLVLVLVLGIVALAILWRPPRSYTAADVDAALLTLADLPGYYAVSTDDGADDGGDSAGDTTPSLAPCGAKTSPIVAPELSSVRQFTAAKDDSGPRLMHAVGLVPRGWTLDSVREVFADCRSWTEGSAEYAVAEANFGSYGDETYALRLTVSNRAQVAGVDIAWIRANNLLSVVVVLQLPDVAADEMLSVTGKAAAKIPA